jgi:hypothetical protein
LKPSFCIAAIDEDLYNLLHQPVACGATNSEVAWGKEAGIEKGSGYAIKDKVADLYD